MLDELRDSLYTTAWFGLMTSVWLGWAQEAPRPRFRPALIAGSVVGLLIAVGFGVVTGLNWSGPTALEGRYAVFGIVVGAEFLLAGAGAGGLMFLGHPRWVAWWVAVVVAAHFASLAWIFGGPSLAWLSVIEVAALVSGAVLSRTARVESDGLFTGGTTSTWVGPLMGLTILAYAVVNGVVSLQRLAAG